MLELRIQDIITGTKDSDQDTAITEVVRVAKMQDKEKMRKLVENVNLVILVVDFVRRTRCAAPMVHMGTYPVVANIYLTYVYSDMLHHLDDMEGFLNRLAAGTLIVLCEVFVAVIVDICTEKHK